LSLTPRLSRRSATIAATEISNLSFSRGVRFIASLPGIGRASRRDSTPRRHKDQARRKDDGLNRRSQCPSPRARSPPLPPGQTRKRHRRPGGVRCPRRPAKMGAPEREVPMKAVSCGWALALAVAFAVPAHAVESPKYGGTLTYVIPADSPPSFDAQREETYATIHSAAPFYSMLIRIN